MVLHHVLDRPCMVIESAAALHAEIFRHGNLYALHVLTVPDWFQKGIGKTKIQDVLHSILAKKVINPIYVLLGKRGVDQLVQGLS